MAAAPARVRSYNAIPAEIRALVERAQQGDQSVLPELQTLLDNRPEIWKQVGDLALHAQQSALTLVAGDNLLLLESIKRKMADLRQELSGINQTPLERLLVERVVLSWLEVYSASMDAIQAKQTDMGYAIFRDHTPQRLESANRRFLVACKGLASVRKLLGLTPTAEFVPPPMI